MAVVVESPTPDETVIVCRTGMMIGSINLEPFRNTFAVLALDPQRALTATAFAAIVATFLAFAVGLTDAHSSHTNLLVSLAGTAISSAPVRTALLPFAVGLANAFAGDANYL